MALNSETGHAKKIIPSVFTAYLVLIINLYLNAQVCFTSQTSYVVGINPISLCYADFNADGKIDLATANNSAGVGEISILLGSGTGSFSTSTSFAVGAIPRSLCTGDFNNDGKPDLATNNTGPGNVSILLGNGAGGFTPGTDFTTSIFNFSSKISSADFNADGFDDLVITSGSFFVLAALSNGNGSFAPTTSYTANNNTHTVITSDFNADGKIDLAVTTFNDSNFVTILPGDGMGGFGTPASFSIGDFPASLINADFNGDGKTDLASSNIDNNITGNISVLLGNGIGSFSAFTNFGVGSAVVPNFICSADFDGDGNLDLATASIANNNSGNVTILPGNGAGNFGSPINFAVDSFPNSIIAADFNADGKIDIATATTQSNIDSGIVSVLLNCNTTGTMQPENISDQLKVYPNPNNGFFHLSTDAKNIKIKISNVFGEIIHSSDINQEKIRIDLSNQTNGIYFLRTYCNDRNLTNRKIIIQ
ncbi:hypothetical protein BH11BAC1_BH11BAC1_09730 [soil metagenome]